jgi:hypothetical protein
VFEGGKVYVVEEKKPNSVMLSEPRSLISAALAGFEAKARV